MEQLIKALANNFGAILSGVFAIVGVLLGWVLNILTAKYQNRPSLIFKVEGTPESEFTEPELRTKTSLSDLSIQIINAGKTACFLESFEIIRKGHMLVECYDVCSSRSAILPNKSILYTLMEQDADALQFNFSKYYKPPRKAYLVVNHALRHIPVLRNRIADPMYRQGECSVIAYGVDGKKIYGRIDLALLYIRHASRTCILPNEQ